MTDKNVWKYALILKGFYPKEVAAVVLSWYPGYRLPTLNDYKYLEALATSFYENKSGDCIYIFPDDYELRVPINSLVLIKTDELIDASTPEQDAEIIAFMDMRKSVIDLMVDFERVKNLKWREVLIKSSIELLSKYYGNLKPSLKEVSAEEA